MRTLEVSFSQVRALDPHPKFGRYDLPLAVPEGHPWRTLNKELTEQKGGEAVPLFYLDEDRHGYATLLWKHHKDAVKYVVTDGPIKGYVGYFRYE